MEAAAARKPEDLAHNLPASCRDFGVSVFERGSIDHNQRAGSFLAGGAGGLSVLVESARQAAIVEARIVRAVVLKVPAKNAVVEAFRRFNIA